MPYSVSYYGNPHSRTHTYGWESEQAVEHARKVNTVYPCVKCHESLTTAALTSDICMLYRLSKLYIYLENAAK